MEKEIKNLNYDEVIVESTWTAIDIILAMESCDIYVNQTNYDKAITVVKRRFLELLEEEGHNILYEVLDLVEDYDKGGNDNE